MFLSAPLVACATPTAYSHQPSLSRAEVARIAEQCASQHQVRRKNYFPMPELNFEYSNDHQWGVYFFRKPERNPNKGFLITVDDRTKRCSFSWFSELPTE
jgi:hypothetical protein